MPAQAGIHADSEWTPAFAGVTGVRPAPPPRSRIRRPRHWRVSAQAPRRRSRSAAAGRWSSRSRRPWKSVTVSRLRPAVLHQHGEPVADQPVLGRGRSPPGRRSRRCRRRHRRPPRRRRERRRWRCGPRARSISCRSPSSVSTTRPNGLNRSDRPDRPDQIAEPAEPVLEPVRHGRADQAATGRWRRCWR